MCEVLKDIFSYFFSTSGSSSLQKKLMLVWKSGRYSVTRLASAIFCHFQSEFRFDDVSLVLLEVREIHFRILRTFPILSQFMKKLFLHSCAKIVNTLLSLNTKLKKKSK